jgi:heme/copper-type cytochrome/quinol oxidase subunit 3
MGASDPSTFFAPHFTLSGLHALHIFCGIAVGFWLLVFSSHLWKTDTVRF